MCGRFTLTVEALALGKVFDLPPPADWRPRYNVAPTQPVLAVVRAEPDVAGAFRWLRWGLVPAWAKDPTIGARMINARAETAAEKPSFRSALRHRRCLIPTDGFYEWRQEDHGKQPYHVQLHNGGLFAFAGLWERWDKGEHPLETCTILTTEASAALRALHHRMPVILRPADYARWLDPTQDGPSTLADVLRAAPDVALGYRAANPVVNNARNDSPDCLAPPA